MYNIYIYTDITNHGMHVLNQMKHQGLIESASQSPGESSMTKPGTAWCPPVVRWFSPLTIDISTTKPSEIEVFFLPTVPSRGHHLVP